MQRKIIDAHVHITPTINIGNRNKRFHTEVLPYGTLRLENDAIQIMPCFMKNSVFDAEMLIHLMDYYGVEKSVLLQSLMSEENEVIAKAVEKYPDRLAGAMVLELEGEIEKNITYWYKRGLKIIKFEMRAQTSDVAYPGLRYDDSRMLRIFDEAEKLGLTVVIDPAPVDFPIYQPMNLEKIIKQYKNINFVICHLGYPRPINTTENREKWKQMISLGKYSNCWIDVAAIPDLFDEEGWPYRSALKMMSEAKAYIGAFKFIWGTDITGTLNRATYSQMISMFEKYEFFTEKEKEDLFYYNAKKVFCI